MIDSMMKSAVTMFSYVAGEIFSTIQPCTTAMSKILHDLPRLHRKIEDSSVASQQR